MNRNKWDVISMLVGYTSLFLLTGIIILGMAIGKSYLHPPANEMMFAIVMISTAFIAGGVFYAVLMMAARLKRRGENSE